MQVMNGGEFEDRTLLIGQVGETKGFGVSNDPILMSMLSTGLYGNPLRTMIQEIMFNAWDAHRMGNCQDKPVDVYINMESGFMVRDYGPGISPEDMHPIYCIYGNSTKRGDANQTGGFGLGSKSPFAYTDSFMVTSMHKGSKSMYIAKRCCEDKDGGPGLIPVIQNVPCEEHGLMVSIPLKSERDMVRAYEFLKDILFLSGIKANLHYAEEKDELIESLSLSPNEFINQTYAGRATHGLWAVYGGVRYKIEKDDGYLQEYVFIEQMSHILGTFYIGFPAHSLTPLPNREGLNLSEKSVESIKVRLETIQETFMSICIPALKVSLEHAADCLKKTKIETDFLAKQWKGIGGWNLSQIISITDERIKQISLETKPENTPESVWFSMIRLCFGKTNKIEDLVGAKRFHIMKAKIFMKTFPGTWKYRQWLGGHYFKVKNGTANSNPEDDNNSLWFSENVLHITQLRTLLGVSVDFRMEYNGNFNNVTFLRNGGEPDNTNVRYADVDKYNKHLKAGKIKFPLKPKFGILWDTKRKRKIDPPMMMRKVIIIAKTVQGLNDTTLDYQKFFSSNYSNTNYGSPYHFKQFITPYGYGCVPGIVVPDRRGFYEKAIEFYKLKGYQIIEGAIPEKKKKSKTSIIQVEDEETKKKREIPTFPALNSLHRNWVEPNLMLTEPLAYICCTESTINSYDSYNKPSGIIMKAVSMMWPKQIAILHNRQREPVIVRRNVPKLIDFLDEQIDLLLKNEALIKRIFIHQMVRNSYTLPEPLLKHPEVQKAFRIPFIRNSKMEEFDKTWAFLDAVVNHYNNGERVVSQRSALKIREAYATLNQDDEVKRLRKTLKALDIFDAQELGNKVNGKSKAEVHAFALVFLRFLKTM